MYIAVPFSLMVQNFNIAFHNKAECACAEVYKDEERGIHMPHEKLSCCKD